MHSWLLIAIVVGVAVAVLFILLCMLLGFSTKSWINNVESTQETNNTEKQEGKNMVITDPFSGKLMNLERVSNASSLRSTRSIGFIAYDNPVASHSRGRVTPVFHTGGSMKSVRSNKSALSALSTSAGAINEEVKYLNVNPLFKEDASFPEPCMSNSSKMRARGLIFE